MWLSIPHACFFISSCFFPLAPLSSPAELERAIAEEVLLIPACSENVFGKLTALDLAVLTKHSHGLRSAKWEQGVCFVFKKNKTKQQRAHHRQESDPSYQLQSPFLKHGGYYYFLNFFFFFIWPKFLYYPLPANN